MNRRKFNIGAIMIRKSRAPLVVVFLVSLLLVSCNGSGGGERNGDSASHSIARVWDEAILAAIRIDTPRPPVHARNLWHLSVAMYDAWAAYDPVAVGYLLREKSSVAEVEIEEARRESISYAAYRVLRNRYALSVNAETTLAELDSLIQELGYDETVTTIEGSSPAAIGNRAAAAVIAFGNADGSNQSGNYADPSYTPANSPLVVSFPGNNMADPNAWQPLALEVAFTQNGLPEISGLQRFVCPQWEAVTPFALTRNNANQSYVDLGGPPRLGSASDADFKTQMIEVVQRSSLLSPDFNTVIDLSPGAYGNNPLGTNGGTGHAVNPVTGESYQSQVVKLGDFGRVIAEYWADGPQSETPPGHWNTIANNVSDHELATFQFQGQGQELDRLEWDVKLYFVLNAAVHDAAVNCWGTKRRYDSVRPISAIRYMATKGQSSDPGRPSYHPEGLPLVNGLSELITAETWPTGKHAGIACCTRITGEPGPCVDSLGIPGIQVSCVGEVALFAWPGQPADRDAEYSGVRWVRAKEWTPYQLDTFVTPAFAGYNSGHSTFSRAAAEVLTAFTGSKFFPGGLAEVIAEKNSFLTFELGPSEEVRLQWATYFDAADQAGQSRIYGGIHIRSDDFTGRIAGSEIGKMSFAKAKLYFDGTIFSE